jgi:hypothetical protein
MPAIDEERIRPRGRERNTTLNDLGHRMDLQDGVINAIRGDQLTQAQALQSVQVAMAQMAKDVNAIAHAIGEEKEDGEGNYLGTGLLGRTRRVERAQRSLRELYHRWIAFGSGFVACGGIAITALWWLLGDKLGLVLKGTGH